MVIQRYFRQINGSLFWNFAGLSLLVMSTGMSIAIARSDNNSLTLTKTAYELKTQSNELEKITQDVQQNVSGKRKKKVENIKDKIEKVETNIDSIIVETIQGE